MRIVFSVERPLFSILLIFCVLSVYSDELPQIFVFTHESNVFNQTIRGMNNELEGDYSLKTIPISKKTTVELIEETLTSASPKAIVLMGNRTINLYKKYVMSHPEINGTIPLIALYASQLEKAISGLKNVNGIDYETPMVTALVNFRTIFGTELDNVGVIYRDIYKEFVLQHSEYCKREEITIKSILVGNDASQQKREIKKALRQLVQKDKVDAFWIPNDNCLLTPNLLLKIWIPMFNKHTIPVIVGVEALVKPELRFGTYAVIPEPIAMGDQAAQIIFDLEESEWEFEKIEIFPAISVYTVLNKSKLSGISTKTPNLKDITKVLQLKK